MNPEEARRGETSKGKGSDKGKGNKGDTMPQAASPEDQRVIVWDEENRINSISDHGHTFRYVYNDRGERVIKTGDSGDRTVYVNQYFTVKDQGEATKHVFAGPTRTVSKVTHGVPGDSHSSDSEHKNTAENDEKNFIYFYHPDHLGSTGYVTDGKGKIYEHVEYFPFGETWVQEDGHSQNIPLSCPDVRNQS